MSEAFGARGAIPPDNTLAGRMFLRFQADQARQQVGDSHDDPELARRFLSQFPHVGGDVLAERMAQAAGGRKHTMERDEEEVRAERQRRLGGVEGRGGMLADQDLMQHRDLARKDKNASYMQQVLDQLRPLIGGAEGEAALQARDYTNAAEIQRLDDTAKIRLGERDALVHDQRGGLEGAARRQREMEEQEEFARWVTDQTLRGQHEGADMAAAAVADRPIDPQIAAIVDSDSDWR